MFSSFQSPPFYFNFADWLGNAAALLHKPLTGNHLTHDNHTNSHASRNFNYIFITKQVRSDEELIVCKSMKSFNHFSLDI